MDVLDKIPIAETTPPLQHHSDDSKATEVQTIFTINNNLEVFTIWGSTTVSATAAAAAANA